jgi:aspartyl protease family protein
VSNGDQAANFLYLLGCLVLVASGLMVRRLPLGQGLKMALAWLLIFAAIFIAFTLKDDFLALGRRVMAELRGDKVVETKGEEIRIRRAEDGHFWVNGELNGRPVRFLVDSGATVTTISAETAARVGIAADGGFGVLIDTANGRTLVDRGVAGRIRIGPIQRSDLGVHIARGDGDTNVIGMNFLSTLSAWGVEGSTLRLKS